jgi:uncharacterized membrane protein
MRTLLETRAGRRVGAILAAISLLTVLAIVLLWPSGENSSVQVAGIAGGSLGAEVVRAEQVPCPAGGAECLEVGVELDNPPPGVEPTGAIQLGDASVNPDVSVGDRVRVTASPTPPGAEPSLSLVDFERRATLLWLALGFTAIVLVFGRLRGGLSLLGLLASLAIVLGFIVPAIRDGSEPVLVAVAGSLAVMLVTISLAHGLGGKSAAAMLGTSASLALVAGLALLCTELAHITGFSSEEATLLGGGGTISIQGLLLAGMVIGALGVLDDVTVSQASTVMALRAADPRVATAELYRRAIAVGRDHISATVNTLVLAYVGASLPVLLIFSAGGVGFSEAINAEVVAAEVVAMLVGSIGLIAAVPITTGLAALLATRLPERTVAAEAVHGHVH